MATARTGRAAAAGAALRRGPGGGTRYLRAAAASGAPGGQTEEEEEDERPYPVCPALGGVWRLWHCPRTPPGGEGGWIASGSRRLLPAVRGFGCEQQRSGKQPRSTP